MDKGRLRVRLSLPLRSEVVPAYRFLTATLPRGVIWSAETAFFLPTCRDSLEVAVSGKHN